MNRWPVIKVLHYYTTICVIKTKNEHWRKMNAFEISIEKEIKTTAIKNSQNRQCDVGLMQFCP